MTTPSESLGSSAVGLLPTLTWPMPLDRHHLWGELQDSPRVASCPSLPRTFSPKTGTFLGKLGPRVPPFGTCVLTQQLTWSRLRCAPLQYCPRGGQNPQDDDPHDHQFQGRVELRWRLPKTTWSGCSENPRHGRNPGAAYQAWGSPWRTKAGEWVSENNKWIDSSVQLSSFPSWENKWVTKWVGPQLPPVWGSHSEFIYSLSASKRQVTHNSWQFTRLTLCWEHF